MKPPYLEGKKNETDGTRLHLEVVCSYIFPQQLFLDLKFQGRVAVSGSIFFSPISSVFSLPPPIFGENCASLKVVGENISKSEGGG